MTMKKQSINDGNQESMDDTWPIVPRSTLEWLIRDYTGDVGGGAGVPQGMIRLCVRPVWERPVCALYGQINQGERGALFTGPTGSGKTASMIAMMGRLVEDNRWRTARYCQFADLAAEYAEAKRAATVRRFWHEVSRLDVLAIDEIVDRAATSVDTELMYALIDRAYSGMAYGYLMLAGNVDSESLDRLFGGEAALIRRRLHERFSGFLLRGAELPVSLDFAYVEGEQYVPFR